VAVQQFELYQTEYHAADIFTSPEPALAQDRGRLLTAAAQDVVTKLSTGYLYRRVSLFLKVILQLQECRDDKMSCTG